MIVYKPKSDSLQRVKINPFKLEKDIQQLVENNLSTLFGLEFIKSELIFGNFRFDTVFDNELNSFVIISIKKVRVIQ